MPKLKTLVSKNLNNFDFMIPVAIESTVMQRLIDTLIREFQNIPHFGLVCFHFVTVGLKTAAAQNAGNFEILYSDHIMI